MFVHPRGARGLCPFGHAAGSLQQRQSSGLVQRGLPGCVKPARPDWGSEFCGPLSDVRELGKHDRLVLLMCACASGAACHDCADLQVREEADV